MFGRLMWIGICAVAVAFVTQAFFGSLLSASTDDDLNKIVAQDVYAKEQHEIRGMVMAPSSCHDISVRTKDLDATTVILIFETWQQPYRTCEADLTPKKFSVVVIAPENTEFKAMVDNEWRKLELSRRARTASR